MNTSKSTPKNNVKEPFDSIFNSFSEEELLEQSSRLMCFKFLSEIEQIMEEKEVSKKMLAERVKTSASYITQLFRGDRLANFSILAKIQEALEIQFAIKALPKTKISSPPEFNFPEINDPHGFWVFKNFNSEYGDFGAPEQIEYNEEEAA